MVGVVVPPVSLRSEVALLEVKQCPTDLEPCQVEEMPNRLNMDGLKSLGEPHESVGEDIISGLKAAESRVVPEHCSRQLEQTFTGILQQSFLGVRIASVGKLNEGLQLGV